MKKGTKIATITEAMEDQEHGAYDFTEDGKCSGCGGCCSNFLPMTEKEIRTIKRYVKKHNIRPQRHVVIPMAKPVHMDLTCPFLDDKKETEKCTIYEVRPAICRYFVCNDPHGALKYQELYQEVRMPVDVRGTFF